MRIGFFLWLASQPHGLRGAARSIGWLGLEQMVRMVTGLAVGIYVARHLGPAGYGVIGYATALMLIGSATSRMGLQDVVTRDLVRCDAARQRPHGRPVIGRTVGKERRC